MAGIVKSTKRRYLIGKRIKEVEVPGTELDTDLFFADLNAVGGIANASTVRSELNRLPAIVKSEAVLAIISGARKTGNIFGFNGDTKSVEGLPFERNSSASYTNGSGNLIIAGTNSPRIDFDAASGAMKGYMFEKANTNLMPYSGMGQYGNFAAVYSNDRSRCSLVTESNKSCIAVAAGGVFRLNAMALTNGQTYTYSFYIKSTTAFDLRAQNYSGSSYAPIVIPVTTQWNRVMKTFVKRAGSSNDILHMYNADEGEIPSFYIADIQLEEGSIPTSYIPTTDSAATRLADKLTSNRPIAVYPKNSFYLESDGYTGWFGDGVDDLSIPSRNLFFNSHYYRGSAGIGTWALASYSESTIVGDINIIKVLSNTAAARLERTLFLKKGRYSMVINAKTPVPFRFSSLVNATLISEQSVASPNSFANHHFVFDVIEDGDTTIRAYYGGPGISIDDTIEIDFFTLVKGEEPMLEWSPAPEELVKIDGSGNLTIESNGSEHLRSLSLVPRALTQEEI